MPRVRNTRVHQPEASGITPASKYQRYRLAQRAKGLKEVRLWAPDPGVPGFQERLDRQIEAINASQEERDIMRFIEAAADWPDDDDIPEWSAPSSAPDKP